MHLPALAAAHPSLPEPVEQRLQNILSRLQGVRKGQDGQYHALCPCHDDTRPSLGVRLGAKPDTIVVQCLKGCPTSMIVPTIGLTMAYLGPQSSLRVVGSRQIVATYDYHDTDGTLLFQVVRFDPKDFRQRRPDPTSRGGWQWSIKGAKVVPYRLPELIAADKSKPVYIVEGEKDCDRLTTLGLVATCNAMGAAKSGSGEAPKCKWRREHADYLRSRHVVVIPDNDQAGRDHATGVAATLVGVAASVKVLELPGLPDKGDVSDWLDNGGTAEKLTELAAQSPITGQVEPIKVVSSAEFFSANYQREYLIDGVLTQGEPCIVGGRSKTLKTSLAIDLALALGTGGKFLDRFAARRCRVMLLSGESGDYTVQETARRIAFAYNYDGPTADVDWGFELPCLGNATDLAALEAAIEERKTQVLIVDPVYLSLMGETTKGLNASNLFDVGPLLMRIAKLCKSHGVTLILLHHCRKNSPNEKYDPPELEELSMSGFGEFARQWILAGRRETYNHDGNHRLWLSVGGSAGHSGLWAVNISEGITTAECGRRWEIEVTTANESEDEREAQKDKKKTQRRADNQTRLKERLLEIIRQYPGGESQRFLRQRSLLSSENFNSIAELLESDELIERCSIIKGRQSVSGWRPREAVGEVASYPEFTTEYLNNRSEVGQVGQVGQNTFLEVVPPPQPEEGQGVGLCGVQGKA